MLHNRNTPYIIARSGREIKLNPDTASICIEDIAWGLAHQYRFGGHTKTVMTVAEHSIMVADRLKGEELEMQLAGLLHDASEGYLGDMKSPHKTYCSDYQTLEAMHMEAIFEAFDISISYEHSTIKQADDAQFNYESMILNHQDNHTRLLCLKPDVAYQNFLAKFNDLQSQIRKLA